MTEVCKRDHDFNVVQTGAGPSERPRECAGSPALVDIREAER
jgi:hypothetical protein